MSRRQFLLLLSGCSIAALAQTAADKGPHMLRDPIFVYNNWSSYDELSDNVPLTEQLAMKELDELLRLRRHSVRFDYYMMDAFWFAKDGGYRTWRKPTWPNGPDRWMDECRKNGIRPGMWFGTNLLVQLDPAPEWLDSLNAQKSAMCFYKGGFLPHFIETLQYWYDRGIRMFKFDFVDFGAATPEIEASTPPAEIRMRNESAFREALAHFRESNPDVVLVAFNGFGGNVDGTSLPFPFLDPIDLRWLGVFDTLYSGDPRPSDVPMINFWRSADLYGDHMVRRYNDSYLPLERVDSTSVMFATTGTDYYRRTGAWKSSVLLMMARGGWINTIHGNMELINDRMAEWLHNVQSLYLPMQAVGRTKTFGGVPGDIEPYGFASLDANGALYVVVNPTESVRTIAMPELSREQHPLGQGRILFRDAGFQPALSGNSITLGPEQLALVGYGQNARAQYDLGIEEDVRIHISIEPIPAAFTSHVRNEVQASVAPPQAADVRIIMRQRSPDGQIRRTWAGGPPNGKTMGKVFQIHVQQQAKSIPVEIQYDKAIWSGLSWAAGEVRSAAIAGNGPLVVTCSSGEKDDVKLEVHLYAVKYR
ncbi:MAG TPA: hypothetical protein VK335_01550 [Bryobacteraceae bacterium]|nr:hypothetical protein [Bryobacteraceae bacterium]